MPSPANRFNPYFGMECDRRQGKRRNLSFFLKRGDLSRKRACGDPLVQFSTAGERFAAEADSYFVFPCLLVWGCFWGVGIPLRLTAGSHKSLLASPHFPGSHIMAISIVD